MTRPIEELVVVSGETVSWPQPEWITPREWIDRRAAALVAAGRPADRFEILLDMLALGLLMLDAKLIPPEAILETKTPAG